MTGRRITPELKATAEALRKRRMADDVREAATEAEADAFTDQLQDLIEQGDITERQADSLYYRQYEFSSKAEAIRRRRSDPPPPPPAALEAARQGRKMRGEPEP